MNKNKTQIAYMQQCLNKGKLSVGFTQMKPFISFFIKIGGF